MCELTKSEWKLFQERVPKWQERYMEKLLKDYVKLIESADAASDAFWELEHRIKADKKHPGVLVELRKSEALFLLRTYLKDGIIGFEDLDGFRDELKDFLRECN